MINIKHLALLFKLHQVQQGRNFLHILLDIRSDSLLYFRLDHVRFHCLHSNTRRVHWHRVRFFWWLRRIRSGIRYSGGPQCRWRWCWCARNRLHRRRRWCNHSDSPPRLVQFGLDRFVQSVQGGVPARKASTNVDHIGAFYIGCRGGWWRCDTADRCGVLDFIQVATAEPKDTAFPGQTKFLALMFPNLRKIQDKMSNFNTQRRELGIEKSKEQRHQHRRTWWCTPKTKET